MGLFSSVGKLVGNVVSGATGGLGSAAIGAAGNILGGVLGANAQKKESEANREFQEEMSNTSVRRRIEDLKAAGLNPLLALEGKLGSAPMPTSSAADVGGLYANGVNNAMSFLQKQIEIRNANKVQEAESNLKTQQALTEQIKRQGGILENKLKELGLDTEKYKQKLIAAQTDKERMSIVTEMAKGRNLDASTKKMIADTAKSLFELETAKLDPTNTPLGMLERHRTQNRGQGTAGQLRDMWDKGTGLMLEEAFGLNSAESVYQKYMKSRK